MLFDKEVVLYKPTDKDEECVEVVIGYDTVNECENRVGLRWTGENGGNPFPKGSGGQPRYFFLPKQFTESFLRSILYKKGANDEKIIEAIKNLK